MSEIINVEGESVSSEVVILSMWMIENNVNTIDISYSGSGDGGDINCDTKDVPENIQDIAFNLFSEIVYPNFNDSGSYGNATFFINDGILTFQCEHHDVIETTDDTNYEKDLLDTSKL